MTLFHARALEVLTLLADGSVSLIFADPPYFRVKSIWWDRQWNNERSFLDWIGVLGDEFKRVLASNGSLYICASPAMSYGVEGEVRKRFNVLNSIRWHKDAGWHKKAKKEELRSYLEPWEAVIFAEQWGGDGDAMNESGYLAQSDKLRGSVFEPIRAYLAGEFKRAGVPFGRANEFCGVASMAGRHYFSRSQWCMPTEEHYKSLQRGLNAAAGDGAEFLRTDYESLRTDYESLRTDYESLRTDYESLRRPFALTKDRPTTDLWTYETVPPHDTRHPCEKPMHMLLDIVETSSRPGNLVVDPFMGRCSTGVACQRLGRRFVGGDFQKHWVKASKSRLLEAQGLMRTPVKRAVDMLPVPKGQRSMFDILESNTDQRI